MTDDVMTCTAFASGSRRCCALPEPGFTLCVIHLKASGWMRCGACQQWIRHPQHQSCPSARPLGPRLVTSPEEESQ